MAVSNSSQALPKHLRLDLETTAQKGPGCRVFVEVVGDKQALFLNFFEEENHQFLFLKTNRRYLSEMLYDHQSLSWILHENHQCVS